MGAAGSTLEDTIAHINTLPRGNKATPDSLIGYAHAHGLSAAAAGGGKGTKKDNELREMLIAQVSPVSTIPSLQPACDVIMTLE